MKNQVREELRDKLCVAEILKYGALNQAIMRKTSEKNPVIHDGRFFLFAHLLDNKKPKHSCKIAEEYLGFTAKDMGIDFLDSQAHGDEFTSHAEREIASLSFFNNAPSSPAFKFKVNHGFKTQIKYGSCIREVKPTPP